MNSWRRRHDHSWRRLWAFLLVLTGTVPAADGLAQQPNTGIITGRIASATTGRPIPSATVTVLGSDRSAVTTNEGRFTIREVPVDVARLRVIAIGFEPREIGDLVVSSGRPAVVQIALTPLPVQLADLFTIPQLFGLPPNVPSDANLLDAEEIRRSPGSQEDVLRTVALLPGVGVTSASRNDLVVRGGAPFENLFTVDRLRVGDLNHFGTQGSTGGPVSLINLDLVEDVSFSAGAFGSRWGNRTGSVTSIRLREGNVERLTGKSTLSATGFGVSIDGPIDSRTTLIGSVRRSYLDLLFSLAGFSFLPSYWDATAKVVHELGPDDRLSFTTIGALDRIEFKNDDAEDRRDNGRIPALEQDRLISGLTWSHSGTNGQLNLTAGYAETRFRTEQRDSLLEVIFSNRSRERVTSLDLEWLKPIGDWSTLRMGAQIERHSPLEYAIDLPGNLRRDNFGSPQPLLVDTTFGLWQSGGFAELRRGFANGVSATVGARLDRFTVGIDKTTFSPRLSVTVPLSGSTKLTARGGQYWQAPSLLWLVGDPANEQQLAPFRVDAAVLGLEHRPQDDIRMQVEAYLKDYSDYPARVFRPQAVLAPSGFGDAQTDIPFGLEPISSTATGLAYGVEFLAQKRLSAVPIYGLMSLSIGRVEFEGTDGVRRPGAYDTRVIATVAAGWRPNPSWEYGAKFRVASGAPTTPFNTEGPERSRPDFNRYNAGPRLPVFHALDIRIDRRWVWSGVQLVGYLDIQNILDRENASRYEWDDETQAVSLDTGLGRLPSIGLSIEW